MSVGKVEYDEARDCYRLTIVGAGTASFKTEFRARQILKQFEQRAKKPSK